MAVPARSESYKVTEPKSDGKTLYRKGQDTTDRNRHDAGKARDSRCRVEIAGDHVVWTVPAVAQDVLCIE
jgi:hypothetical protein